MFLFCGSLLGQLGAWRAVGWLEREKNVVACWELRHQFQFQLVHDVRVVHKCGRTVHALKVNKVDSAALLEHMQVALPPGDRDGWPHVGQDDVWLTPNLQLPAEFNQALQTCPQRICTHNNGCKDMLD